MGIYQEYLDRKFDWPSLEKERKKQLHLISEERQRPIMVYASALNKKIDNSINFDDRLPFQDQLSNVDGNQVDILIETPGGSAEIAEDMVNMIRSRFSRVGMIIPGYAKSAGTIMALSGDEILMEPSSALGPIDAQIFQEGKRFSAHAYLEGFKEIKEEVEKRGILNRAYVPILLNITPADLQGCKNAQDFSKTLVTQWLSKYKFKYWEKHSSTHKKVTDKEKITRAEKIADDLCNHGTWLSHGRSITIKDLENLKLKITDYSKDARLCEAIRRYYTLLLMTFETTNIYKVYETPQKQIYKYAIPQGVYSEALKKPQDIKNAVIDFECTNCKKVSKIQANLDKNVSLEPDAVSFPQDNIFICPYCKTRHDLIALRIQIESQSKRKII